MATNDEVKAFIAERIQAITVIDGPLVRDSVAGNVTLADWNAVAGWINTNNAPALLEWLRRKVDEHVKGLADTEADTLYADQTLNHTEIERLFF